MLPLEQHARFPDWPDRLAEVVREHALAPFAWGRYDCATLWVEAIAAMTGFDAAAGFSAWRTERGALTALRRRGFASVADYVATLAPRVAPARAGRGDLGFPADPAPLMSPAIILGAEAVSRNEYAWIVLPRSRLVTCYRV